MYQSEYQVSQIFSLYVGKVNFDGNFSIQPILEVTRFNRYTPTQNAWFI